MGRSQALLVAAVQQQICDCCFVRAGMIMISSPPACGHIDGRRPLLRYVRRRVWGGDQAHRAPLLWSVQGAHLPPDRTGSTAGTVRAKGQARFRHGAHFVRATSFLRKNSRLLRISQLNITAPGWFDGAGHRWGKVGKQCRVLASVNSGARARQHGARNGACGNGRSEVPRQANGSVGQRQHHIPPEAGLWPAAGPSPAEGWGKGSWWERVYTEAVLSDTPGIMPFMLSSRHSAFAGNAMANRCDQACRVPTCPLVQAVQLVPGHRARHDAHCLCPVGTLLHESTESCRAPVSGRAALHGLRNSTS